MGIDSRDQSSTTPSNFWMKAAAMFCGPPPDVIRGVSRFQAVLVVLG